MDQAQVVIIGGGPAGLLLALKLHHAGIAVLVLEKKSREYVLARIRAGVLEAGLVTQMEQLGIADRLHEQGHVHEGVNLAFGGELLRIDFAQSVGKTVTVYGQTEITRDLYAACDSCGIAVIDEADDVALHDVQTDHPHVTWSKDGADCKCSCDFIAGCDGFHGISRRTIDASVLREYEHAYPFGWLGVLSPTPPVADELIYAYHERGFALCSMRNPKLSRYYIQCPIDTSIDQWPDERFWDELRLRLPEHVASDLVAGDSVEKSIAPLRSYVAEPISWGRLHLAGDAAHIVPPTGAKGLNLAASDVYYLANALISYYSNSDTDSIASYSRTALARVWQAVRFSWWMTRILHATDEGAFADKIRQSELDFLRSSKHAQRVLAENYVGVPY